MAKKTENIEQIPVFTKEQILWSKKYANRRDVLGAILEDGKQYTLTEVDTLLDKFMKGKVK